MAAIYQEHTQADWLVDWLKPALNHLLSQDLERLTLEQQCFAQREIYNAVLLVG